MALRILVIHGKGVDVRGVSRESQKVFGTLRVADYNDRILAAAEKLGGITVAFLMTNDHEKAVSAIAGKEYDAVVINPGGWCKDDVEGPAIAHSLAASGKPAIEVHYSNIHKKFESKVAPGCTSVIVGAKVQSYILGLQAAKSMCAPNWRDDEYQEP